MRRTIEEVVEELKDNGYSKSDWDVQNFQTILFPNLDEILEIHKNEVRPKGKWIKQTLSVKPFGEDTVLCDKCAFMTDKDNSYNFCPNCGADMRGESEVKE